VGTAVFKRTQLRMASAALLVRPFAFVLARSLLQCASLLVMETWDRLCASRWSPFSVRGSARSGAYAAGGRDDAPGPVLCLMAAMAVVFLGPGSLVRSVDSSPPRRPPPSLPQGGESAASRTDRTQCPGCQVCPVVGAAGARLGACSAISQPYVTTLCSTQTLAS
jgi:hypothetical protein